jgi:DNA-binding NtrC family response regulator
MVVDDEAGVRTSFERMLAREGYDVITASRGDLAVAAVDTEHPDLVVMDVHLPGMDGLEAFRRIKAEHPLMPVIIMTGYGTTELAIEATKLGAFDYQVKPFAPDEMLNVIGRALESARLMQRAVAFDPADTVVGSDALIGQSAAMRTVYKDIGRVASTQATVLIRGETGTGKELVARALYQHSQRAGAPLVVVNCVAIPEGLLESELFGHERGAFTGAIGRRIGKFEQAHGGTLFLDEIGDLAPATQAKLLRALQERAIERVGGSETVVVDVRVIAATNRDLEAAIAAGTFRRDLYHRLNVVTLTLPALRQRGDDIPRLAGYFLERGAAAIGVARPPLSPEALAALRAHPWPGNVRELEHCIERVLIYTQGRAIQANDVVMALGQPGSQTAVSGTDDPLRETVRRWLRDHSGAGAHAQLIDVVDELLIAEALQMTGGNQSQAARVLGLTRPTLWAKMRRHGMGRDQAPPPG